MFIRNKGKLNAAILLLFLISVLTCACLTGCSKGQSDKEEMRESISINKDIKEESSENTLEEGQTGQDKVLKNKEEPTESSNSKGPEPNNKQVSNSSLNKKGLGERRTYQCTFSITCKTVFDNLEKIEPTKQKIIPSNGIIYAPKVISFSKGDSAFDLLLRETRTNKIHMEHNSNPGLRSNYIEGINNLYEFDCGPLSGWTYKVNGRIISQGSSNYLLSNGDVIEWVYTCDQGRDIDDINQERNK